MSDWFSQPIDADFVVIAILALIVVWLLTRGISR